MKNSLDLNVEAVYKYKGCLTIHDTTLTSLRLIESINSCHSQVFFHHCPKKRIEKKLSWEFIVTDPILQIPYLDISPRFKVPRVECNSFQVDICGFGITFRLDCIKTKNDINVEPIALNAIEFFSLERWKSKIELFEIYISSLDEGTIPDVNAVQFFEDYTCDSPIGESGARRPS
nr:ORF58 [Bracoviriform inaniti]